MADPNLDTALYRMKAYGKLLADDADKADIAQDILTLTTWIDWARPLIGQASADQFSFSDIQRRHAPKSPD